MRAVSYKMLKTFAKLKQTVGRVFRATLNFQKFKVSLDMQNKSFVLFSSLFIPHVSHFLINGNFYFA